MSHTVTQYRILARPKGTDLKTHPWTHIPVSHYDSLYLQAIQRIIHTHILTEEIDWLIESREETFTDWSMFADSRVAPIDHPDHLS
jgi:hypothetical protein